MIINQNAADMSLYDNLVNRELMHIKCFHELTVDNKIAVIMRLADQISPKLPIQLLHLNYFAIMHDFLAQKLIEL